MDTKNLATLELLYTRITADQKEVQKHINQLERLKDNLALYRRQLDRVLIAEGGNIPSAVAHTDVVAQ